MSDRPRLTVLHVLEAVGHGTARHLLDLVTHAAEASHVVVVPRRPTTRGQSPEDRLVPLLRARDVRVHTIDLPRVPTPPRLVRAVRVTHRTAVEERAAILHGHATTGGIVARAVARRAGLPSMHTPHGVRPTFALTRLERGLSVWTDVVVAVSPSEAALLARLGVRPRQGVHVVPNGVTLVPPPPSERDLRHELGLDHTTRLVGWVGRLARQKAPDVLVEALAHLPTSVHAVMIGGGPDAGRVTRHIARAGLDDRVHVLGHVPEAARLLPQLDVLALPSRWEGAPYVPLEAFRAGVPVVATDVVGTRDVVVDGETGWLVPVDDPVALAAALREVIDDPDEARRRASLAHDRLVAHHDVRAMAAATVRLYRHVTSSQEEHR